VSSRTRTVAVRAASKDSPVSRVLSVAAASVVTAAALLGAGAAQAADLALGKAVFEGNCGELLGQ